MVFKINKSYAIVPEGTRELEITEAKLTPSGAPKKLTVNLKDVETGATLLNNFSLDNDKSVWAMGMFVSTALGLNDGDIFDTNDLNKLIGVHLMCEVVHREYNGRNYANISKVIELASDKTPANTNDYSDL